MSGSCYIKNCGYTSYGSATIGGARKGGHIAHSREFSEYFDDWGDVKLVADGFICFDCYEDNPWRDKTREVDPDEIMAKDDPEYRRKHAMYVLHVKLGIPLPVIQTHITPLLYNCCYGEKDAEPRFDCPLCNIFEASEYSVELQQMRQEEKEEEREQRKTKKRKV